MNVFDFDGTIYDGDSSIDFFLFCIKKKPSLARFFPQQIDGAIRYKLGFIDKQKFKEIFFSFLEGIEDVDSYVFAFWNKHYSRMNKWYLDIHKNDDIIISASPEFLLEEIAKRMDVQLIATKVDKHTGKLLGANCYGIEKTYRIKAQINIDQIDKFYSDSKSDSPMAELAKEAFIVSKSKISVWEIKNDKSN